jgi:hypothetical protein
MEARAAELSSEQKTLDKNFKKEFADAEHAYQRLLHLYRTRFSLERTRSRVLSPEPPPGVSMHACLHACVRGVTLHGVGVTLGTGASCGNG